MKELVLKWIIAALGVLLAAYLVPDIFVASFYIALIVAALLGLLNLIARPILIVLTLPITIVTLGLFTLVINGLLFWFLSTFVQGFEIGGFLAAFVGALVVSAVNFLGEQLFKQNGE